MIAKPIIYFGEPYILACDAQCHKAWGWNERPKEQLSDNPDDVVYLADSELGDAPRDPGTYEGACAKPEGFQEWLNKWRCRECERSVMAEYGEQFELRTFAERLYNIPRREPTP